MKFSDRSQQWRRAADNLARLLLSLDQRWRREDYGRAPGAVLPRACVRGGEKGEICQKIGSTRGSPRSWVSTGPIKIICGACRRQSHSRVRRRRCGCEAWYCLSSPKRLSSSAKVQGKYLVALADVLPGRFFRSKTLSLQLRNCRCVC
jgi:hypothetical protein